MDPKEHDARRERVAAVMKRADDLIEALYEAELTYEEQVWVRTRALNGLTEDRLRRGLYRID
jgi:hypothetical protein